jgi:Lipocalin-like domain
MSRLGASLMAATLLGCAHSPASTEAPPSNPLVGMWRLVEVVAVRPNGATTTSGFGKQPTGLIVYDQSGWMAAQIMSDPRPTFRDPEHPIPAELEAALDGYLAYAGRYDFDPATSTVTHHVQMSVDPQGVGKDLRRKVERSGDRVTLTTINSTPLGGEQVYNRLTWERVSRSSP